NQSLPSDLLLARENVYEIQKQHDYLAQIDYVLPMGDAQFEAGYRGNFERESNDYQLDTLNQGTGEFEMNQDLTNVFNYDEYGNEDGELPLLLGVGLEDGRMKGSVDSQIDSEALQALLGADVDLNCDKNYLGLFPTVNLIYELAETANVSLGYNRRINRPRGWFINPFPSRSSRTNIWQGNPDLDPAYSNAFDLGYLKRWDK